MAQEAQKRVQEGVTKLLGDLDSAVLRKMQQETFQCSANCCADKAASSEQVANCVESCSTRFRKAQTYITNELTGLQGRLERCALSCQDSVRDKMTAETTDQQMKKFEGQFEQCVMKCADDTGK
ncbi:PREDICTED: protein FAM136A-like, partial [Rhagoletis zephyria]|uniref:protein FAM136A-like n=1 Tax=Rhagoletis zephyria TaxID=28612 RepID=UPI0008114D8A